MGTSVAQNLGARSLFLSPAALGFERELNGSSLMSSFSWNIDKNLPDELRWSLAFGSLGLGIENLGYDVDHYQRYSAGIGVPFNSTLFFGTRVFLNRSQFVGIDSYTGLDLSLQYRPLTWASFGVSALGVNQWSRSLGDPNRGGLLVGATFLPLPELQLSVDVLSQAKEWDGPLSVHVSAQGEIAPGIFISAGYDSQKLWHLGARFNLGAGGISAYAHDRKEPSAVMHLDIGSIPKRSILPIANGLEVETAANLEHEGRVSTFFTPGRESFAGYLRRLREAGENPAISVVLIRLDHFPLGSASAEEVHATILALKAKGKIVHVTLGNAALKEYFIASAANSISLDPSGSLRLLRPRSERYYLKGTLDKIGIGADLIAKGEYKSAPEMITRKGISEPAKQNIFEIIDDSERILLARIKRARKATPETWEKLEGLVFYSADEAKKRGLIDEVLSFEAMKNEQLKSVRWTSSAEMVNESLRLPPRIAVIVAEGDILERSQGPLALAAGSAVTPEKMGRLLDRALGDPRTKGIVLRVSSPGGEILASNQISELVRQANEKKPVFVSMGDVAASGGYYISAPASRIYIPSLGITGSIGVFTGKPTFGELYKKIDLRKETFSHSPYAGILSEARPWSKEERAIMVRQVDSYYATFLQHVSRYRKLDTIAVDKVARGRVWTGERAHKEKLVDSLGGVWDAVEGIAAKLNLGKEYEAYEIAPASGPFDLFDSGTLIRELSETPAIRETARLSQFSETPFLYWYPGAPLN